MLLSGQEHETSEAYVSLDIALAVNTLAILCNERRCKSSVLCLRSANSKSHMAFDLLAFAGIRIFCTEERSQGKNRERAMSLLRSKLFDLEQEKQRSEIAAQRKSQVRFVANSADFQH